LTSNPVLPAWIGTLALEDIPGRWGKASVVAEQENAPTYKQLFNMVVEQRSGFDAGKAA